MKTLNDEMLENVNGGRSKGIGGIGGILLIGLLGAKFSLLQLFMVRKWSNVGGVFQDVGAVKHIAK